MGQNFNGRLTIAFVIALIGLFTYFSQVQENPVTGKKKQNVAISSRSGDPLGNRIYPAMSREMGGEMPAHDVRNA